MDNNIVIIIGFLVLLACLFGRVPIFLSLAIPGLIGIFLLEGMGSLNNLGYHSWESINKWSMLAVPGFVLMGNLFLHHGFGADIYDTTYKWLGRLPGGLIIATVFMSALFGFISGSATAGVATIGAIAIPEVEKRGYDRRLALGAFAISGSLASLIPPSIAMIIYAVMTDVSIGALFVGGIVPGILLASLISLFVFIRSVIKPSLCPPGPPVRWRERLKSMSKIIPVILTFIFVLGGIYMGVWSAVEAAAAGAAFAFLICLLYRRLSFTKILTSLHATVRITAMVLMIFVGASFLNHFLFLSGANHYLTNLVLSLNLPKVFVIIIVLAIMTIMGCFLDVFALLLLSIPVFAPIIVGAGYDLVWFGIIMIVETELALVTPPVGFNLYVIKDLAPSDTTMGDVMVGSLQYIIVVWVLFLLLVLFPELVLWLPGTMG